MNYQLDPATLAAIRKRATDRAAMSPDEVDAARAIIAKAEQVGFVREPSLPEAYDLYLPADAADAERFLDDLATNDPDRCETCGAGDLCDCSVYLVN